MDNMLDFVKVKNELKKLLEQIDQSEGTFRDDMTVNLTIQGIVDVVPTLLTYRKDLENKAEALLAQIAQVSEIIELVLGRAEEWLKEEI